MNRYPFVAPAVLLVCLTSCAVKRELPFRPTAEYNDVSKVARYDYSNYSRVPDRPTSFVYRSMLKTIPYTREHAFWGNWGGCGSKGGTPVDAMDEIFRRHDIIYYETRSLPTMRAADKACVAALHKLDTTILTPQARAYQQRAIGFFSNPMYAPIGKPLSCFVYRDESPYSPFQTQDDLHRFFQIEDMATSDFTKRTYGKQLRETRDMPGNKPKPNELALQAD